MYRVTLPVVLRDVSAASSAVATLITAGLLSGTVEHWTTGILGAVTAAILTLTTGSTPTASTRTPTTASTAQTTAPLPNVPPTV